MRHINPDEAPAGGAQHTKHQAQTSHIMIHPDQILWRSQVLQGMLWVCCMIGVPVGMYILMTNSRGVMRPATLLTLAILISIAITTFSRQWHYNTRAIITIVSVYLSALLSALFFGFTIGTGLLMLLVVEICVLFFGIKWLYISLFATGATLAGIGLLQVIGLVDMQQFSLIDFSQGQNVFRVTIAYLILTGIIAISMSYVVRRIEQSLRETAETVAQYETEKRERGKAEAALQESAETYRLLVENINDVIYATDAHGVLTYISPAVETHSGYEPSELIGQSFFNFVYENDKLRVMQEFERILAGQLEQKEFRVVIRSGEIRWIRTSSRRIHRDGHIIGVQGVYIDITEKLSLEGRLRQTYKMEAIGTLAGGIAHEFNNMLAIILGFTELAQRQMPADSAVGDYLQHVRHTGDRAKELIQQILTFSRHSEPVREPLSVAQTIQDVQVLLRASLPATIDMRLHLNDKTVMVLANRTQLHQVLINLCSNAEYAMRRTGGILEIAADIVEVDELPWVQLIVRDTGGGIDPDIMDRIFDPFFTTKDTGEGTGMGLAIVHGIITSHGGRITVESSQGDGTTFKLYLPCLVDPVAVEAAPSLEHAPGGAERILFVDDEAALTQLGKERLEPLGYDVVTHTSSLEALREFQANPHAFDLVIADQTMPAMSGIHLIERLRRARSDIPVILCTGFSHMVNAESVEALGIEAVVMKPEGLEGLALTIRRVLDARA